MNEVVMEVNTLADTVYQASEKLGENSCATEALPPGHGGRRLLKQWWMITGSGASDHEADIYSLILFVLNPDILLRSHGTFSLVCHTYHTFHEGQVGPKSLGLL